MFKIQDKNISNPVFNSFTLSCCIPSSKSIVGTGIINFSRIMTMDSDIISNVIIINPRWISNPKIDVKCTMQ